jgi:hypothetical protein
MNIFAKPIVLVMSLLLWTGCASKTEPTPEGNVNVTPNENILPIGHPPIVLPPESRETKRMTISMLEGSLPVVASWNEESPNDAPITWTVLNKGKDYPALGDLALGKTLGKPDYVQITSESAVAGTLYVKFMEDMARNVCTKMAEVDMVEPDAEKRNLIRFASLDSIDDGAAINANLRYLKLRFWGEYIDSDDDEAVAELKQLFDASAKGQQGALTQKVEEGWRAVCVGLLSAPDFHIY